MSDVKAGFPRVAPPPEHIPPTPRSWAAVQHMGVEEAVRLDGGDDRMYEAYERLLAEERARYRRHQVIAWSVTGACLGHITFAAVVWLLP